MRKILKGKKLATMLLALAMLLCSFPVISAEAMNTGNPAEEITAEMNHIQEDTTGSDLDSDLYSEPEAVQEAEPEACTEAGMEAAAAPDTDCVPETDSETEDAVTEAEAAEEPEAAEDPEDQPEEESEPEGEEEPAGEDSEADEDDEVEFEGSLYEFDDDDAGYVSEELLNICDLPGEDGEAEFAGYVDIGIKEGEIAFGRDVTLVARVSGAEMLNYRLIWEANDGDDCGWYAVGTGSEYSFLLTRENAGREYRVVLYTVN